MSLLDYSKHMLEMGDFGNIICFAKEADVDCKEGSTSDADSKLSGFDSIHEGVGVVWDDGDAVDCESGGVLAPVDALGSSATTSEGSTLSLGNSRGASNENIYGGGRDCISGDSDDRFENMEVVFAGTEGLAGLENLRNTCFMNSALQCLVHTPQLVEYFLKSFTHEINNDNPLGMNGELALAFGSLLRELWCSGSKPVAPNEFKEKLGLFASQFCGDDQHDSQEFLAFLLDGLHEDLNRVKQKPYIQAEDNDGRPDREVADELWRYHKARNDSVFVNTCQGQYKSTLICPVCDKKSTTFDPFMYLSLPLRSRAMRKLAITVFYGEGSSLARIYIVTVPENGCCIDLQNALGAKCCIKSDECVLLAEVFEHRIYRYFEIPTEPLTSIKYDHCIVAYILPKRVSGLTRLEICHSRVERTTANMRESKRNRFLTPLVTFLEDPQSGADIDLVVSRILSPLRRKPSCTSTIIDPTEENENKCTTNDGQGILSIGRKGSEEMENSVMSFKMFIMNDHSINSTPIKKDTAIGPRQMLKVMLDWSEEDEKLHDIRCLLGVPMVYQMNNFEMKAKEESISLFSCLNAFMKEEPLGVDNMWYCSHCKEHVKATKKLDLWMLPDILVFHLKRFSYCRGSNDKIDAFVDFPIQRLDLSEYVQCTDASGRSHIYDLYAISNHYGELSSGHYTAYCKCNDDRWYLFDDAYVCPVEEFAVKSSNAYMLFYKRVDDGIDPKHSNGEVKSFDSSYMFNKRVDVDIGTKHSNGEVGESFQGWQDYFGTHLKMD